MSLSFTIYKSYVKSLLSSSSPSSNTRHPASKAQPKSIQTVSDPQTTMCHHVILRWACGCKVQDMEEKCRRYPNCTNSTFDENWTAYDCPTHRGKLHPHSHLYGPGETRYQGASYSVRMGKDTACEFGDIYDYGDASKHQEEVDKRNERNERHEKEARERHEKETRERHEKEARKHEREERLRREDKSRREDLRNRLWK